MDIASFDEVPKPSFWAKLKKSFSDSTDVSVRGDLGGSDSVALDIQANALGTAIQMKGSVGK